MYFRNDDFETQNQQQNSSTQLRTETCEMCASCPYSQTCSIANGNISMPNYTDESQGEMTRQYHMHHPQQYHHMQYYNPYFHHHFHPGFHQQFHPNFNPFFNPFFTPFIFAPFIRE